MKSLVVNVPCPSFPASRTSGREMAGPHGKSFCIPVDHRILKADGSYYPLEAELIEVSSEGQIQFVELFSDYGDDEDSACGDDDKSQCMQRPSSR